MIGKVIRKIVPSLRRFVYNRGMRPKQGSILYSPSLNLIHRLHDYHRTQIKRK
jgi:hypothetical protein